MNVPRVVAEAKDAFAERNNGLLVSDAVRQRIADERFRVALHELHECHRVAHNRLIDACLSRYRADGIADPEAERAAAQLVLEIEAALREIEALR